MLDPVHRDNPFAEKRESHLARLLVVHSGRLALDWPDVRNQDR
jgi:hypothetical protein